jgi:hypothetical protein
MDLSYQTPDFLKLLNGQIDQLFHELWRLSLNDPRQAFFALKMVKVAKKAASRREKWERQGLHVPGAIPTGCIVHRGRS